VQAAHALTHTKTYLAAQFWRQLDDEVKRAAVAAHSILVIAYHLLQRQEPYRDLGSHYRPTQERQLANAWLSAWKNWATRSCSSPKYLPGSLTVGLFSSQ